jgi:inosine-uridine preferring nucleoside hydrolase
MTSTPPWLGGPESTRLELLLSSRQGRPRMVLDTDTYNEIDDQFALVHSLLSPDRVDLQAIYAAPFENARSRGPEDGMEKSYDEIQRILGHFPGPHPPVFRGARQWLTPGVDPAPHAAAADLVGRALSRGAPPLYVVAIGAPTNVVTALMLEPKIARSIVVVWLGGHALHWPTAREFNLRQDLVASRFLLDSGVPLVLVPCGDVADHLSTTRAEVERYVRPGGRIGDFLAQRYAEHVPDQPGTSKVIWDMAATGWVQEPSWATTRLVPSPLLTSEMTWSHDHSRHLISVVTTLDRDAIFGDFFDRLSAAALRTDLRPDGS